MGYRYNMPVDKNGEPPKPEEMLPRFMIRNGATLRIAFKCYYALHNHDHPMYVYPHTAGDVALLRRENHAPYDKLSQAQFPIKYREINLVEENDGASPFIEVVFEDDDGHISIDSASVDSETPSIIRISMDVQYPEFHDKPIEKHFTVFMATAELGRIDAVCHAIVTVLPGVPYPHEEIGEQDASA